MQAAPQHSAAHAHAQNAQKMGSHEPMAYSACRLLCDVVEN